MDTKRVAKIHMSLSFLNLILRGDMRGIKETTAPKDLEVIKIEESFQHYIDNSVAVYFTSKDNKFLKEGEIIPEIKSFIYTSYSDEALLELLAHKLNKRVIPLTND